MVIWSIFLECSARNFGGKWSKLILMLFKCSNELKAPTRFCYHTVNILYINQVTHVQFFCWCYWDLYFWRLRRLLPPSGIWKKFHRPFIGFGVFFSHKSISLCQLVTTSYIWGCQNPETVGKYHLFICTTFMESTSCPVFRQDLTEYT